MRITRENTWDLLIVAGGLLLASTTDRAYRYLNAAPARDSHSIYSVAEADLHIETAKAVLTIHPDDLNALSDLAIAQYQKHSYVEALNALEKARALGATDEALFFYAGVMYNALGLPDYAANEFSKYLRHYPNDYEASIRLANAYVALGRTDEALSLYKQALHRWPKDPTSWFNYAVVNVRKSDPKEASVALDQVQALAGALPVGGYFERAEIARLQGLDDHAIPLYNQELSLHPNDLVTLQALEAAQRRKGLLKDAYQTHRKWTQARIDLTKVAVPTPHGEI